MSQGLGRLGARVCALAGKQNRRAVIRLVLLAWMLVGPAGLVMAEGTDAGKVASPDAPPPPPPEKSIYDKIWGYTKLYNNAANPWLEELSIVGREQVDTYAFDAKEGDAYNFSNRRTRIGFKAKVLGTVTVHSEVDLNLEGDDDKRSPGLPVQHQASEVYSKLTDAYVKWSPQKYFNFTVGKQSAKFTLDGSTSSTQLVTIDRSNLANNIWFTEEYIPGVSVSGDIGKWSYNAGYFASGDSNSEFGTFGAGSFLLLSGGYDFAEMAGVDKGLVRLDYVWQDPNTEDTFTSGTKEPTKGGERDVVSLNSQWEKGRWGLYTDLDFAEGNGTQSNLYGGQITPSMKFCDTWQVVLRYTGIGSEHDNGIKLARYESHIVGGKGDAYNEIYLGLNKYFYGHKLKWQSGIQYASMDDSANDGGLYKGWGVTTGLRVSW